MGGEGVGVGIGWGGGDGWGHGGGLLFVVFSALVGAAGVGGAVAGNFEEPGGEEFGVAEGFGFLCEEEEDGLGDVFGEVGRGLAFGGGVDEADVARGEGTEGVFVALEEGGEEFAVGGHGGWEVCDGGGRGQGNFWI